ncbi:MAG: four helix bundle protein [Patescibacteria group bacterium]
MIHKIGEFYKKFYLIGPKIGKRDRHGIYLKIETQILDILGLTIEASFAVRSIKLTYLFSARIKIEVVKRLIRLASELEIIKSDKYIEFESDLQEISKMTNGWIRYLQQGSSQ